MPATDLDHRTFLAMPELHKNETPAVQVLDDPDGRHGKFFCRPIHTSTRKIPLEGLSLARLGLFMGSEIVGVTT
jgi:hypothetical protein